MPKEPIEHFEAASTLAVVVSSNEPLLFLSEDQKIIAASASFCRAFNIDPATIPGRQLSDLGNGEWAMPRLASLLKATASGSAQIEAYEIDLKRPNQKTRNLIVNARTLDDGDKERVRLLLAITDMTDARAEARLKDDLIREKAMLMQEVQHRVANSLQIIASVLMQSAPGAVGGSTRTSAKRPSSSDVDCGLAEATLHIQGRERRTPHLFHAALRKPRRVDDR